MPIPALNAAGFLPPGIFDCTLTELRSKFGTFQGSDRRTRLFVRLEELFSATQSSGLFGSLLVDGSFVTDKPAPNDIDLVAVLLPGHNFERDLPMSEYSLVSRTMLHRRFGFDVMVAERDTSLYNTYIEFFGRVRDNPDMRKGLLRLSL
jgi:hypothetical protein